MKVVLHFARHAPITDSERDVQRPERRRIAREAAALLSIQRGGQL